MAMVLPTRRMLGLDCFLTTNSNVLNSKKRQNDLTLPAPRSMHIAWHTHRPCDPRPHNRHAVGHPTRRVDVGLLDPLALVGMEVRVRWDDGGRYAGRIRSYNEASFEHRVSRGGVGVGAVGRCACACAHVHAPSPPRLQTPGPLDNAQPLTSQCPQQIVYDDGDVESVVLAEEPDACQLRASAAEAAAPAPPAHLSALAMLLLQQAESKQQAAAAAAAAAAPSSKRAARPDDQLIKKGGGRVVGAATSWSAARVRVDIPCGDVQQQSGLRMRSCFAAYQWGQAWPVG